MTWLPDDFAHPLRADLPTGQHLRPMGPEDTEVDRLVGTDVERALDDVAERWLREAWPLPAPPRFVGCDLTWAEWNALPPRDQ